MKILKWNFKYKNILNGSVYWWAQKMMGNGPTGISGTMFVCV